jgi:metal-sulfur cluster biosynthetic enzyme
MPNDEQVWDALRTVIDPEIGINVVDLGLVYDIEVSGDQVRVAMTMTTQACPLHAYLTEAAETAIRQFAPDVGAVQVDMVWDPPWSPAMMSDEAKQQLGWSS